MAGRNRERNGDGRGEAGDKEPAKATRASVVAVALVSLFSLVVFIVLDRLGAVAW